MAPRTRSKYKERPRYTFQDSPFLELPREIRDLIYFHALTKSEPIDLWPGKILSDEDIKKNSSIQARLKKPSLSFPDPRFRAFRDQHDLQWVRKELAVGLLSTCTQVYDEAWRHFWCQNSWKFSHDVYWIGIRRFLTTIGSRMRKSIKNMQVIAAIPSLLHMTQENDESRTSFQFMSNHPKLRMAKVYHEPDEQLVIADNLRFVGQLLALDGPDSLLQQLTFVVPNGFAFGKVHWDSYDRNVHRLINLSPESGLINVFSYLPPLSWLKKVLILESGSVFQWDSDHSLINPGKLLKDHGIEVICQAGSIVEPVTEPTPTPIEWRLEDTLEAPLAALRDLFIEPPEVFGLEDDMSTARKARTKKETAALKRVLKGFGGCRFERRKMWMRCDWDIAVDNIPEWWAKDRPRDPIVELVFVNVKNPNRAHKTGVIIDPGRAARGWWSIW